MGTPIGNSLSTIVPRPNSEIISEFKESLIFSSEFMNRLLSTEDQLIRSRDSNLQQKKTKKKVIKKRHYYQFFIKETCLTKSSVLILVRIEP